MGRFGLEFLEEYQAEDNGEFQEVPARIWLGDTFENIKVSTTCWSPEAYRKHWSVTTSRLRAGERSVLFCSSVYEHQIVLWPVICFGNTVTVRNLIVDRSDIVFEGYDIRPSESLETFLETDRGEWSEWSFPLDYVL